MPIKTKNKFLICLLTLSIIVSSCSSNNKEKQTLQKRDKLGQIVPQVVVDPVPDDLKEHNEKLRRLALPRLTGPFPYESTFLLHSAPSSNKKIYIDFDGITVTNSRWNDDYGQTIVATPFDTDGNSGSFSNAEKDIIQGIWQRVAEDYLPFFVDVTTEDPGDAAIDRTNEADENYGTRTVVTNSTTISSVCGCGGLAFTHSFNNFGTHQFYQPAWVFKAGLGGVEKNLAEAVSHETGHTLGLSHDGKGSAAYYEGPGAWTPIMGYSYYRPLTQFSKGEYIGATNVQDDYAIMIDHGLTLRTDDHGNTIGTATALNIDRTGSGIIENSTDTDVFSFTTAGETLSFTASPASRGPDLDIKLELLNSGGSVLVSNDPTVSQPNPSIPDSIAGLNAVTSSALSAGTYYLRVTGVGSGSASGTGYSNYASRGAYSISAAAPPSLPVINVGSLSKLEGNSGATINFLIPITLSKASTSTVTITATTSNGTATAPGDYAAKSASISFAPGVLKKTLTVVVRADKNREPNETFTVTLSNPSGVTIGTASAVSTIKNDD